MNNKYFIKSDRYDRIHKFVKVKDGDGDGDWYRFQPEHEWMSLNIIYGNGITDIKSIDTDGGPMLCVGYSNGEIEIREIRTNEDNGIPIFRLVEV